MMVANNTHEVDLIFSTYAEAYYDRQIKDERMPKLMDYLYDYRPALQGLVEDWGCGPGHWSKAMDDRFSGLNFNLYDVAAGMLVQAQSLIPQALIQQADCRSLAARLKEVEVLILGYVIPYLNEVEMKSMLRKACASLTTSGILILAYMSDVPYRSFTHEISDGRFALQMNYHDSVALQEILDDAGLSRIYSDEVKESDFRDVMEIWICNPMA